MTETADHPVNDTRDPSRDSHLSVSDRETDTFEDAVDTASVRSLTNRKASGLKSSSATPEPPESVNADAKKAPLEVSVQEINGSEGSNTSFEDAEEPKAVRLSTASTNASMDNVNLDDETVTQSTKDDKVDEKHDDKAAPQKEASKTISLSGIKGALPSMPWAPGDDKTKRENQPLPPPPPPEKASNPPPARKLTSPFSWLSRNSTPKENTASPPVAPAASRRNTASSVATITSNPEMMLSKLEEEGESRPTSLRNSLKDRFKFARMREEAGVSMGDGDDKSGGAIANLVGKSGSIGLSATGVDDYGIAQTPTSPIPTSPDPTLAPGTVVGVSAGPSAIDDTPVDWDLWQAVVYEGPAAVAKTSAEDLNKAIATGIPNVIRGVIWQVLAQSKSEGLEVVYKELVARGTEKEKDRHSNATSISSTSNGNLNVLSKEPTASSASSVHSDQSGANGAAPPSEKDIEATKKAQAAAAAELKKKEKEDLAMIQKLEKTIKRDMGARTSYSKFAAAAGLQDGLFGVCKAYALFDEAVGYAQGMNFIVMPILFNMPEEEAFCLLVRLMHHYHLRDLFVADMPGLHKHLYQFERLLEDLEPALYCHLHRRSISPHLYATQWFLTLFAYRFPLQLVLRIYDLILSEGLSAILKFGIVLMQKNAQTLLGMNDMSQLTNFLKDRVFDVYIDNTPSAGSILESGFFGSSSSSIDKEVYRADQLVRDACEVKVTPELLKVYTTEWEEKTRAEKERETELEHLRASNANLTARVRKLEEQIETVDREQTALATELVHTKVENEELKDENESLKGQVAELRVVIEKQPEEIESSWQMERADLMKRNEKVHDENQKLEKELAELEEELVQTKMRYAEINDQHEALTRKWSDIKKQLI